MKLPVVALLKRPFYLASNLGWIKNEVRKPDKISQDIAVHGERNMVMGKGDIISPLPPAEERLRYDPGILLKNVENT